MQVSRIAAARAAEGTNGRCSFECVFCSAFGGVIVRLRGAFGGRCSFECVFGGVTFGRRLVGESRARRNDERHAALRGRVRRAARPWNCLSSPHESALQGHATPAARHPQRDTRGLPPARDTHGVAPACAPHLQQQSRLVLGLASVEHDEAHARAAQELRERERVWRRQCALLVL
eukprot:4389855-Prymnesium_polylepis.1